MGGGLSFILELIIVKFIEPLDAPISNYYFPCTGLYLFTSRISRSPDNVCTHFADEKTEAVRGEVKGSRSHNLRIAES